LSCLVILAPRMRARFLDRVRDAQSAASTAFSAYAVLTLVATVGMLSYLSVRYPRIYNSSWTYVQEERHYHPIFAFLFIALCITAFGLRRTQATAVSLLHSSAAILLCLSLATTGFWRARRLWWYETKLHSTSLPSHVVREDFRKIADIIDRRFAPGMLILYVDLDDNRAAIARIAGAVVVGTDDQAIASVSVIISDLASKPAQTALVIAAVPRNPNSARGLSIKQMAE